LKNPKNQNVEAKERKQKIVFFIRETRESESRSFARTSHQRTIERIQAGKAASLFAKRSSMIGSYL